MYQTTSPEQKKHTAHQSRLLICLWNCCLALCCWAAPGLHPASLLSRRALPWVCRWESLHHQAVMSSILTSVYCILSPSINILALAHSVSPLKACCKKAYITSWSHNFYSSSDMLQNSDHYGLIPFSNYIFKMRDIHPQARKCKNTCKIDCIKINTWTNKRREKAAPSASPL